MGISIKVSNNETLGAKIIIGKSAKMAPAPKKIEFKSDYFEVFVGIGTDHVAYLFLDEDALAELRKMEMAQEGEL